MYSVHKDGEKREWAVGVKSKADRVDIKSEKKVSSGGPFREG